MARRASSRCPALGLARADRSAPTPQAWGALRPAAPPGAQHPQLQKLAPRHGARFAAEKKVEKCCEELGGPRERRKRRTRLSSRGDRGVRGHLSHCSSRQLDASLSTPGWAPETRREAARNLSRELSPRASLSAATLRNPEWEDWTLSTGICPEFRRQLWRPRRLSLSSQDLARSPRWQLLGASELGAGIPDPLSL